MEPIEGNVARILTDRRLVINRGTDHGVEVGMRFAILSPVELDIPDPISGELIGTVPVARTIVKVISVQERMCTAQTFRTYKSSGVFGNLTAPTERQEKIRTEAAQAEEELGVTASNIELRDRAVEVQGEDFEGIVLKF